MVSEAIKAGLVRKLYTAREEAVTLKGKFPENAAAAEVVSDKVFSLISDTQTPQGILATVNMPGYHFPEIHKKENCFLLCIEGINDPGNMGTMIRTAEGAGVDGMILSKETVDIFNPKAVRASMGSVFRVPFFISEDFISDMTALKEKGFQLYAAHLQGKQLFYEQKYQGKTGLLIGNEANGLTGRVSELADVQIKVPMEGETESLNAAVCAGILMYEIYRYKNGGINETKGVHRRT